MEDVKSGKFSKFLVQPLGYFPYRIASYFGGKVPNLTIILTILAVVLVGLNAIWGVSVGLPRLLLFLVTIILAVVLNFLIFYGISAISFWLVEIASSIYPHRFHPFSGGFPEVFGPTFIRMTFLPFMYTISFPIKVLNGTLTIEQVWQGIFVQLFWIVVMYLLASVLWRVGSRRYVAVGG
jgi:ABC-2 type transport system permease protein